MANYEEALKDADHVISLRPDWPKVIQLSQMKNQSINNLVLQGQYRRAEALRGLGRNEDALLALLHCTALEKSLQPDICNEIAKVFILSFLHCSVT